LPFNQFDSKLILRVFCISLFFLCLGFSRADAQYVLGGPANWVITVSNPPTNSTLTNVTIVDTLPADLTYSSCSGGSSCFNQSGMIVWTVGNLAPGASIAVTVNSIVTTCSSSSFQDIATIFSGLPQVGTNTNPLDYTVACLTNTPTMTWTPTATYTPSPTPTNTNTFTPSYTPTITNTPTITDTPTITNTPTLTATYTNTFTPTLTPTITNTFSPTSTATNTPSYTPTCVTYVWPDPYNPKTAVGGTIRFSCMNAQTNVFIYTISGELVQTINAGTSVQNCSTPNMWGTAYCWNGRNKMGASVATGVYLYVVQQKGNITQHGKFLLVDGT
jgi:hypothetical protein